MLRVSRTFSITILISFLGACTADEPVADDEELTSQVDEELASCSVVTTCNAPGPDGARCRQQPGCSVGAAALECELEVVAQCGVAICPVVLIKTNGTRKNLCGQDLP